MFLEGPLISGFERYLWSEAPSHIYRRSQRSALISSFVKFEIQVKEFIVLSVLLKHRNRSKMFFKVFSAQGIVNIVPLFLIHFAGLSFEVSYKMIFKNPFDVEVEAPFL